MCVVGYRRNVTINTQRVHMDMRKCSVLNFSVLMYMYLSESVVFYFVLKACKWYSTCCHWRNKER